MVDDQVERSIVQKIKVQKIKVQKFKDQSSKIKVQRSMPENLWSKGHARRIEVVL